MYTRRRFESTHGGERGEKEGRGKEGEEGEEGVIDSPLTKHGPRRVITCPRGSPTETKVSYPFCV